MQASIKDLKNHLSRYRKFFKEIESLHKTLKGRVSGKPASELVIKARKERD